MDERIRMERFQFLAVRQYISTMPHTICLHMDIACYHSYVPHE